MVNGTFVHSATHGDPITKIYTPDSSPEDLAELAAHAKDVAGFLNANPQATHLLEEARAGRLSEQECLHRLLQLADGTAEIAPEKNT